MEGDVVKESDFHFGSLRFCAACRNSTERHIGCEANRPSNVLTIDAWKAQMVQSETIQSAQQETK